MDQGEWGVGMTMGGSIEAKGRARQAISAVFLVNGFIFASWISRIPTITDKLDLSSGQVGTALMAIAAGAIVSFPLAGRSIDARSSAATTQIAAVILVAIFPFIGLAPNMLVLMPILFILGFGNGAIDVSMNAQGVEVERFVGKSIMSSLHGFFSIGAFAGAGIGAGAAHLDLPPFAHFLTVAVIGAIVLLRVRGWLIPDAPDERLHEESPTFALPPRSLWALGALALCVSMSEGAMADWSGIYLSEELGSGKGFAALGYAAFSVFMLIGRFSGDPMVGRLGPARLVRAGCVLAGVGLAIGALINTPVSMLLGFGAVGLGLATAYPLVFSAAGNHPTLPRGRAVASVATVGYTGFLAVPPLLGWVAEFTSLRAIMIVLVLLAGVAATLAGATRAASPHHTPGVIDEPKSGVEIIA